VLAGVTVPVSGAANPSAGQISHLQAIHDELVARYAPAAPAAAPAAIAAEEAATVVQDPDRHP
jgi:hypothetical protein